MKIDNPLCSSLKLRGMKGVKVTDTFTFFSN